MFQAMFQCICREADKPDDSWDAFFVVNSEENNLKREARIAFFHKVSAVVCSLYMIVFLCESKIW